ncbi:hypothetical protein BDQ12DRAFT_756512 [Crucibulum laeve]|uniref:Uncharacterized protein n=1 Tax=Crucibulum laeve TaxID=68775 RepID=A0A5C3M4B6_9AGAR|nr:hypothetical protein BDQ12DRAFT_756512 [Crucibulum laeve]
MHTNNPYAQGGWYNPANPLAVGQLEQSHAPHPPTFGALPSPTMSPPSTLEFNFTSFSPDIFNCIVQGPQDLQYFSITTSNAYPRVTTIVKPGGALATIQWHQHPILEIKGLVSYQPTSHWIPLSADRSYRTMNVHGRVLTWVPQINSIYLYSGGPAPAEQYGRIVRSSNVVTLEITNQAIQAGMLEPATIATFLLQCGVHID